MFCKWWLCAAFMAIAPAFAAPADTQPASATTTEVALTAVAASRSTSVEMVGWVAEDGGRGTFSLVLSCSLIILLSTWVAIHPGIPPSQMSMMRVNWRRTKYFFGIILAPEFLCSIAIDQWRTAWILRQKVKELNLDGDFTLVHAFYFIMGGVRFRDRHENWEEVVVNPDQLLWLLREGLITWDRISTHYLLGEKESATWTVSEKAIKDRSKADGFAKLFALAQAIWFVVQAVTRRAKYLPVAKIEVVTLGYIFCAVVAYACWWYKPRDITVATMRTLPEMSQEQREHFDSLVEEPGLSHEYHLNKERGKSSLTAWVMMLTLVVFGAIHLLCWNSHAPSFAEIWLWRVASLLMVVLPLVCIPVIAHYSYSEVPLAAYVFVICGITVYFIARISLIVEVFAVLRSQPKTVYDTIAFSNYIFHFQ